MIYRFPPYELDLDACELRNAGSSLCIQRKVFEVLAYLVQHRDRVVWKEELLEAVWAGAVVSDAAVHRSVSSVRRALGQRGKGGPIETVHGRGYRFRAAATCVDPAARVERPCAVETAAVLGVEPFVGRDDVLARLRLALRKAALGSGSMFLLTGEPGIGKTRCAEQVLLEAEQQGARVWRARCAEAEGVPALWPWVQIIRSVVAGLPAEDPLHARAGELLDTIAPASYPDDPEPPALAHDAGSAQFLLLDCLCRFLLAAARRGDAAHPCVVFVDDLARSDATSLWLLDLLGMEIERAPLLVVATLRGARSWRPQGARCAGSAASAPPAALPKKLESIALTGLSRLDVERYVSEVAGGQRSASLAARIHAKTSGNPLFVRELLRFLISTQAEGGLAEDRLDTRALPAAVHEIVERRLQGMDPSVRATLDTAAVLGQSFEVLWLERAGGMARTELLAVLDSAVAAGLLRRDAAPSRYAFTHGVIRDALYGALTPSRAARLHLAIAEALEGHAADSTSPTELAVHFYRALPDGPAHKARRYALQAARAMVRAAAYAEAARFFAWALAAQRLEPAPDPRRRCGLLLKAAFVERAAGNAPAIRTLVSELVELAERHGLPEFLAFGGILLRPMAVATSYDPDPLARRALEGAERLLAEPSRTLRARVLSRLAWLPPHAHDRARRLELSTRAAELAHPSYPRSVFDALLARHLACSAPEDLEEARRLAPELQRWCAEHPTSIMAVEAHYFAFQTFIRAGEMQAAACELRAMGALARDWHFPEAIWIHDRLDLQASFYEGDLERVESGLQELTERGHRLCIRFAGRYARACARQLERERGVRPALRLAKAEDEDSDTLESFAPRARQIRLAAEAGDLELARKEQRRLARSGLSDLPRDGLLLVTLADLSVASLILEDEHVARLIHAQLAPHADATVLDEFLFSWGSVAHYLGVLARFLGDRNTALCHLERAVELNARIGHRPQLARSRLALGEMLVRDTSRAARGGGIALLRAVRDDALQMGLARTHHAADAALQHAGS